MGKQAHLVKGIKVSIENANVLGQYLNEELDKDSDFQSIYKSVQKALQQKKDEVPALDKKDTGLRGSEICPPSLNPKEEWAQWQALRARHLGSGGEHVRRPHEDW